MIAYATMPVELVGGPLCGLVVNWPGGKTELDMTYNSGGRVRIAHYLFERGTVATYTRG